MQLSPPRFCNQSISCSLDRRQSHQDRIWIRSLQSTHPTQAPEGLSWAMALDPGRNLLAGILHIPKLHLLQTAQLTQTSPSQLTVWKSSVHSDCRKIAHGSSLWPLRFTVWYPGCSRPSFGAFHYTCPAIPAGHSASSSFPHFTLSAAPGHVWLLQSRVLLSACPGDDKLREKEQGDIKKGTLTARTMAVSQGFPAQTP